MDTNVKIQLYKDQNPHLLSYSNQKKKKKNQIMSGPVYMPINPLNFTILKKNSGTSYCHLLAMLIPEDNQNCQ